MRGKVAKKLRKDAQQLAQGQDWVSYDNVDCGYRQMFNYKTMELESIPVSIVMLGACGRAVYKSIKNKYKQGKLKKALA